MKLPHDDTQRCDWIGKTIMLRSTGRCKETSIAASAPSIYPLYPQEQLPCSPSHLEQKPQHRSQQKPAPHPSPHS
jgi:hypothetical protein